MKLCCYFRNIPYWRRLQEGCRDTVAISIHVLLVLASIRRRRWWLIKMSRRFRWWRIGRRSKFRCCRYIRNGVGRGWHWSLWMSRRCRLDFWLTRTPASTFWLGIHVLLFRQCILLILLWKLSPLTNFSCRHQVRFLKRQSIQCCDGVLAGPPPWNNVSKKQMNWPWLAAILI